MKWIWCKREAFLLLLAFLISACGNTSPENAPVSTAIETSQPMESPEPIAGIPPKMATLEEAANAFSAGAPYLEVRAEEKYSVEERSQPGVLDYSIQLTEPATLIWSYYWCSADAEILEQNFSQIDVKFELNGEVISLDQFVVADTQAESKPCRMIYTALSEWTPGKYLLKTTATFKTNINDGFGDYPAGEYIAEYTVVVP